MRRQIVVVDEWRVHWEKIPNQLYASTRYTFEAPGRTRSTVIEANDHTAWVGEYLIKNKRDTDLLGQYMTVPGRDVEVVSQASASSAPRTHL